jgi:hypothetical protein
MIKRSKLLLFEIHKKLKIALLDLVQATLFLQLCPMHDVDVLLIQVSYYYLQKLLDSISVLPVLLLVFTQSILLELPEH